MAFNDKVVLITGSSSGIGADAARHLAKLGAKVAIVGRNEKRLSAVAEQMKQSGSVIPLVIVADVTRDADRIVNETIKYFGKLDILVNNAGFAIHDNVAEADLSEFDRLFDTNVRAVINLTKLCVPHLEKSKGNVVNVSSVAGIRPFPEHMSYCMSKAALDQFTKCSALDLASMGIRVNSINPAAIRTNIYEPFGITAEQYAERLKEAEKKHIIGRIGEVTDTSTAIAFLADNNTSSFLTGIIFTIDGGFLLS